jgi:DNA modification methylase
MLTNTILHGDALTRLRELPDCSVQCCVTSPPYFGLRDYGIEGQIGLEASPQDYITKLVAVFAEVRRVLKNDGTLWLNLGDSYASQGESGLNVTQRSDTFHGGKADARRRKRTLPIGFKSKDLMMIPARVAIAVCADGWYLRQDVIWHKPTAMPESVVDRPTTAHEHIFLLAKSPRYYYDNEAIMEKREQRNFPTWEQRKEAGEPLRRGDPAHSGHTTHFAGLGAHPNGRNKRSVWTINTSAYPEAHFATMPPKLIEPCILAGSRPGDIVLDPFMGAGTVALVALQHGRQYIGIELNADYITLAQKRIATIQPTLWDQLFEMIERQNVVVDGAGYTTGEDVA